MKAASYAKAILFTLQQQGASSEQQQDVVAELELFWSWFQETSVQAFFVNPRVSEERKRHILTEGLTKAGASPFSKRLMILLLKNRRLLALGHILEAVRALWWDHQGGSYGQILTALPLSEPDLKALTLLWEKKSQKKIHFEQKIHPALKAGLQINLEGVTYAANVSAQLGALRERLTPMALAENVMWSFEPPPS